MKPPNQSCRPLFESRNCVFNVGEPKWCCEDSWHKFSLRLSSLPQDWTCQKACKTFQTKGECYVSASRWDERSRWSRFTIRLILLSWALSRWESTAFLFFLLLSWSQHFEKNRENVVSPRSPLPSFSAIRLFPVTFQPAQNIYSWKWRG